MREAVPEYHPQHAERVFTFVRKRAQGKTIMEIVHKLQFTYLRDTNKETTEESFDSLRDLLDFMADRDGNRETLLAVRDWLQERGE